MTIARSKGGNDDSNSSAHLFSMRSRMYCSIITITYAWTTKCLTGVVCSPGRVSLIKYYIDLKSDDTSLWYLKGAFELRLVYSAILWVSNAIVTISFEQSYRTIAFDTPL